MLFKPKPTNAGELRVKAEIEEQLSFLFRSKSASRNLDTKESISSSVSDSTRFNEDLTGPVHEPGIV